MVTFSGRKTGLDGRVGRLCVTTARLSHDGGLDFDLFTLLGYTTFFAIGAMTMRFTNLRGIFSGGATASDANSFGGGVLVSRGLTPAGFAVAGKCEASRYDERGYRPAVWVRAGPFE